jgi:adenylosuccinate synthase
MKADIVVGLQFGSEGKGVVIERLLQNKKHNYDMSIRVQSSQSGHTVQYKGKEYTMQSIPCAWVDPNVQLILGPGCFTERKILMNEINMINEAMGGDVRDRLYVDERVFEVTNEDKKEEKVNLLQQNIGSTQHGCGAALINKLWRTKGSYNGNFLHWCYVNQIKTEDTIKLINNSCYA